MSTELNEDEHQTKPSLGPEHPKIRFLAMATLVIISLAAGFLGGWLAPKEKASLIPASKQEVVLKSQGELIGQIAKTVGQSVVSVETTTTTQSFFGPNQEEGAGTGIILTEDGLIMTNRHVVPAGTDSVMVKLSDGTEFKGVSVVGRTNSRDSLDIAFLKIGDTKGKKLVPAKLGDSSKMQVGDPVVAIGNALGQFQNTVTSGVISGYGRSVQAGDGSSSENLENLFQTDAAINPGNSGGPLVNVDGEVIGINTAVAGDAQGIGFAIPINDVAGLIDSVKQSGKLQRPYLGVVYLSITNDIAEQYGLSVKRGAYIAPIGISGTDPVVAGGPADKAGVKPGDIITKIDDASIDETTSLSSLVNKHKVGDKVTLTVLRNGKETKLTATLGAAPTDN
ncbi:MAG TPA: trypsin-like peptidase domain-containing protein [Candidatus Pristimantibacillus sp.]|nr:trypsin-like peptidase domain-containing protein [Candidatus Pristimantibacillus sp.]